MLRLCKTLHRVPPSLFLTDIVCLEHEHPVDGGSFSDIFMATRQGQPVALKRLRVFRSDFSAVKDLTKAVRQFFVEATPSLTYHLSVV